MFADWNRWTMFQQTINYYFKLNKIIKTKAFKICNCILILICFINVFVAMYTTI